MKTVIISRPDRVGDVIITTACLPAIRRVFAERRIILIARDNMKPLFSGGSVVDGFWAWPGPAGEEGLVEKLKASDVQAILHFHPDPVIEKAALDAGVPKRLGFVQGEDSGMLTDSLPYRKSEGEKHEAEYCLDLVRLCGKDPLPEAEKYKIAPEPEAERRLIDKVPWLEESKELILVNPTTARLDLRWPPDYFTEVGRQLSGSHRKLVLIGHPEEDPGLQAVRTGWRQLGLPSEDVSGQLDLAELAHLMKRAVLYISRDTGTSHLAAAVGCPQVAIMGRPEGEFSPTRWNPLGENVEVVATRARRRFYETRRMFWRRSFRSIQPERVVQAACRLLKDSG
jgi:ADP-heptose:LPS heptosyltransferase